MLGDKTKNFRKPQNDAGAADVSSPGAPKPMAPTANDTNKPNSSHHFGPSVSPAGRTEQLKQINADIAKRPPPAGGSPSSAPVNPTKKFSIMDRLKSKGGQIKNTLDKVVKKHKRAGQLKQINESIKQTKAQNAAPMPGVNSSLVGKNMNELLDILKVVGVPKKGIGPEAAAKMKQDNDTFLAAHAAKQGQIAPKPVAPAAVAPPAAPTMSPAVVAPKALIGSKVIKPQQSPHVEAATKHVKSHATHGKIKANLKKVSAPSPAPPTPLAHPQPTDHAVKSPEAQRQFSSKNIIPKEKAVAPAAAPAVAAVKSKIIPKGSAQNTQAVAAQDKKNFESEKAAPMPRDSWDAPTETKASQEVTPDAKAANETNSQNTAPKSNQSTTGGAISSKSGSGKQSPPPYGREKTPQGTAGQATGQSSSAQSNGSAGASGVTVQSGKGAKVNTAKFTPNNAPAKPQARTNVSVQPSAPQAAPASGHMQTHNTTVKHAVAPAQAHSHLLSMLQNLVNPGGHSDQVVRHSQHFMGKSEDINKAHPLAHLTPDQQDTMLDYSENARKMSDKAHKANTSQAHDSAARANNESYHFAKLAGHGVKDPKTKAHLESRAKYHDDKDTEHRKIAEKLKAKPIAKSEDINKSITDHLIKLGQHAGVIAKRPGMGKKTFGTVKTKHTPDGTKVHVDIKTVHTDKYRPKLKDINGPSKVDDMKTAVKEHGHNESKAAAAAVRAKNKQNPIAKSIEFATPEQKATRTSAHETKQHQKLLDLKDKNEDVKKPENNRNKLLSVIKNCGSRGKP